MICMVSPTSVYKYFDEFEALTQVGISYHFYCSIHQINVSFLWTDIALEILETDPTIANAGTECWRVAMEMLARKPFSIGSESQLSFWKSLLHSC